MNKQEFTIAKFQICSEIDQSILENWVASKIKVSKKLAVDIQGFKQFLLKKDMEEYTHLLIHYLEKKRVELFMEHNYQPKFDKFLQVVDESIDYTKKLAEYLHFLLQNKSHPFTAIKINSPQDVKEIRNEKIIASLITAIQQTLNEDFRKDHGHLDSLTLEEAKDELLSQKDPEWIKNWNQKNMYIDVTGKEIYVDGNINMIECIDSVTGESISGETVFNLMMEDYAFDHEIEREVTLSYLEKVKTREPKVENPVKLTT